MLIIKEVEVVLNSNNIKYYEDLGYKIPRQKNKWGRIGTPKGTKITVKVGDLPKQSNIKIKVQCDECDKKYMLPYYAYNKHNHNGKTYCNKCSNTIFISGENNGRWNSNLSYEERQTCRKHPKYTEFIKKVLIRDNYTCQCCGKKKEISGRLIVHHLDGHDWCEDKRTDETNGVTLCEECHKNFHSIYGYGGNTKEQFEKWIGHAVSELEKYNGELPTTRKVYCIEEDKIYDSAMTLAKEWGIKNNGYIYNVCNHKKSYKTVKGKHLLWLDEYLKIKVN